MLAEYPDDTFGRVRSVGLPLHVGGYEPEYRAGPSLGADTHAILAELGYAADDVARLRATGAFGCCGMAADAVRASLPRSSCYVSPALRSVPRMFDRSERRARDRGFAALGERSGPFWGARTRQMFSHIEGPSRWRPSARPIRALPCGLPDRVRSR